MAVPGDLVLRLRLLLTSPAGAECIDGTELNEKNYKPQSESSKYLGKLVSCYRVNDHINHRKSLTHSYSFQHLQEIFCYEIKET